MEQLQSCDHLRVNPCYSTIRRVWYNSTGRKKLININSIANLKNNSTNGKISHKSAKKIITRINWLHTVAKNKRSFNPKYKSNYWWKINMVTLTLPDKQQGSDQAVKRKLLNTLLLTLKRKFSLLHYIWKAEKQGNGNIHFHIATDVFIPYQALRYEWNNICELNGYNIITKNGNNANSVDIHSMQKVKNAIAYMVKYFCKEEQEKEKVKGDIWNCSKSLSVLNAVDIPIDYELNNKLIDESAGKNIYMKESKWCTIIYNNMVDMCNLFLEVELAIKKYINLQWEQLEKNIRGSTLPQKKICNTLLICSTTLSTTVQKSQLSFHF